MQARISVTRENLSLVSCSGHQTCKDQVHVENYIKAIRSTFCTVAQDLVQTCIFATIRATGKLRPVLSLGHPEYRRPVEGKTRVHRINIFALVQDRCKTLRIYKVHVDLIICINSCTNLIAQSLCNFLESRKYTTCTVLVHGTVM